MRLEITALTLLALGACMPLTAHAPLFSVADQTGPPPLTEGVWVALDDDCTRAMATRHTLPRACEPLTLHRDTDGGWRLSGHGKDQRNDEHTLDMRLIIVPAVPTATTDAYAPLYIAEYDPGQAADTPTSGDARTYAVLAPIGGLPARELFMVVQIDCGSILREGAIDGVTEQRDADGALAGCVAENQAAVREAARRAVIEDLSDVDKTRLLFVHP